MDKLARILAGSLSRRFALLRDEVDQKLTTASAGGVATDLVELRDELSRLIERLETL